MPPQDAASPRFAEIAVVVSVKKPYRPHSDNRFVGEGDEGTAFWAVELNRHLVL